MRFSNYQELTDYIKGKKLQKHFGVVIATEEHCFEAVLNCYNEGLVIPHFIGNRHRIVEMLNERGYDEAAFCISDEENPEEAAKLAVDMVHRGKIEGIIKGGLDTASLMKVILKGSNGLKKSKIVCAMSLMQIPGYHKLIAGSDPALSICPTIEDKKEIIENCVSALTNMGIDMPKVAMLGAAETVNPKMQDTIDAVKLKEMNLRGEIKDCIVDGPLSYDLCFDPESARIKGIDSAVAGDPDLVIYPNLVTGNAVSKALVITAGAIGSSIILGTVIPIVLPSRASSVEEKERDILLAVASIG
ncbi:MAG: phosphate acyltransferase [Anaerovoracaceae bacterium]